MPVSAFSDSQGTISRIIHEKAAQKFNSTSPPSSSIYHPHTSFGPSDLLPTAIDTPGEATPTQSDGHLKRIGSSASVTSLPHYFSSMNKEVGPVATLDPGRATHSGSSPGSAGKGWNWDSSVAQYNYTAMRKKSNAGADSDEGKRKRLFFFDQNAATKA